MKELYAPAPEVPSALAAGPERPVPGRWRLAGFRALQHVTLSLAHILIRHEETTDSRVSLSNVPWYTTYSSTERTRSDAWRLAEQIAERARREPESFATLAEELSDDPTTRGWGGDMGMVVAANLWSWPQVLDALAATVEGGISAVVETEQGFHVFMRRAPDSERTVSGARIVLAHTDAPFIELVAMTRGKPVTRSRSDAQALVSELYERARLRPESFGDLARQYSDHGDGERGGDFGTWSSREATPLGRQLAGLRRLQLGEVSRPIETPFGFEIFLRTEDRPRQSYAMGTVQFPFKPDQPETQRAALERAKQIAAALAQRPERFEEMQRTHCCSDPLRVIEGRDAPALEQVLAQLQPGQVGVQPVLNSTRYLLVKRLELAALPPSPPALTELPAPQQVDLVQLVHDQSSRFVEGELRRIAGLAQALPGLDAERGRELVRRHEQDLKLAGLAPAARARAFEAFEHELARLLGPDQLARYRALAERELEQALLAQP